jgi:hypothetical protein
MITMQISRRAAAVVAAVLTGLASLGAAGAAFASSSAPSTHDRALLLRFHTVVLSSKVNDAGLGGPANVVANLFDVQTPGGTEAGKAYISCTVITTHEQLCHAGFVLAGGQIEAQAAIPMTAARFTAAIIGGTGKYKGVTGQIRNVVSGPGVIDRTFYLIQPDHH